MRFGQSPHLAFPGQADHTEVLRVPFRSNVDWPGWQLRARGSVNSVSSTPGAATCSVSGDPHYLTFDGALTHLTGTCTYVLTQLCQSRSLESRFVVSTTNEFRGGNLEASYVRAVHVQVFNLRISLIKGHKVVVRASAHLPGPHIPPSAQRFFSACPRGSGSGF